MWTLTIPAIATSAYTSVSRSITSKGLPTNVPEVWTFTVTRATFP